MKKLKKIYKNNKKKSVISLYIKSPDKTNQNNQRSLAFAIVFVIVWAGSFIITLNAKMLGGKM